MSKQLPLHPLLTEGQNKQYTKDRDTNLIQDLEGRYKVNEMLAFCRVNIDKYSFRKKGQTESDLHKISKYQDYRDKLLTLRNYGLGEMVTLRAWNTVQTNWRYTDKLN